MEWERLLLVALGMLQIAPQEFWLMTPREFLLCWRGYCQRNQLDMEAGAMARRELEQLRERFPDQAAALD